VRRSTGYPPLAADPGGVAAAFAGIFQAIAALVRPTRKLVTVPAAGLRTKGRFVKLAGPIRNISNTSAT